MMVMNHNFMMTIISLKTEQIRLITLQLQIKNKITKNAVVYMDKVLNNYCQLMNRLMV